MDRTSKYRGRFFIRTRHEANSLGSSAPAGSQSNGDRVTVTATVGSSPTATGDVVVASVPTSHAPLPTGFPLGTYTIRTFLDTVQSNCTSNPATWACFPYTVYNESPVKALSSFDWVISQNSNKNTYVISSTQNPFAITFSNVPLNLVDAGQSTERYKFQLTMSKEVRPGSALTSDNAATTCFFNTTTFTAYLYTKISSTYPSENDGSAQAAGKSSFPVWPFQVRIEQSAGTGSDVPNCYKLNNGNPGERVPLKDLTDGGLCSCLYRNVNVPNPNFLT